MTAMMEHLVGRQAVGALPPPPGVTPNLVNPDYIGGPVVVITSVFLPIALVCFAIRMFTRTHVIHAFGADDICLIATMIFSTVESAVIIIHVRNGLGYHIWDIPFELLSPHFLLVNFVSSIFYVISICLLKMSVLLLYVRLSPATWFRIPVYFMMFVVVGFNFANLIALFASCSPLDKSWDLKITTGHCFNRAQQSVASGYYNVFTDAILLALPLPTVWGLQLPFKQKLALTAVFATGSFCLVMSIVRLVDFLPLLQNDDITWNTVNAEIWSILELHVGIITACLATFRPFLRRYAPWILGQTRSEQYRDGAYKPGSNDYWSRERRTARRSKKSYGLSTLGTMDDKEDLDLGDGPKAEVSVSAQTPHDRGSTQGSEAAGHASTDHIVNTSDGPGIIKTTHVHVRGSDPSGKAASAV